MSNDKLTTARKFIEMQKYKEARALLKGMDDPVAQKWLKEIDRRISKKTTSSQSPIIWITVGAVSALLVATFFIAVYAAFLRPTASSPVEVSTVEAIPVDVLPTQVTRNQWEYLEVQYSQLPLQSSSSDERFEIIITSEPYDSLFWSHLTMGCRISDVEAAYSDRETLTCISKNFLGEKNLLDMLGADGWELMQIENNSSQYSYEVTLILKRLVV